MIKHTILLIFCLFYSFGVVYGQKDEMTKNSIRIGINGAFYGAGDIVGPSIYAEYSYSINKYIAIAPRIMSGYAHKIDDVQFDHASSFNTSLALRITPFPNTFQRLKIDFGGLYHRFVNIYGGIEPKPVYGGLSSRSSTYNKEDLFGLIGSLSINLIDNKKIESGLKFDMLTSFTEGYFNSDSWQTGLYFGVKF